MSPSLRGVKLAHRLKSMIFNFLNPIKSNRIMCTSLKNRNVNQDASGVEGITTSEFNSELEQATGPNLQKLKKTK
jgi:hypothetical protein